MKKFVGYVNGKSFDNEKDFNEAANKAIEDNDGNLAISSYYSFTDDEKEEIKDDVNDDRFLSTYEYFLGERKPDLVDANSVGYSLSDDLKKRIANASNIKDIRKSVEYHISTLDKSMNQVKNEVKRYQEDIEKLQTKLYDKIEQLKVLNGRSKYYEDILEIAVDAINKVEEEKEVKEDKQDVVEKNNIKELLGVSGDMTLSSFLKQLGLLK